MNRALLDLKEIEEIEAWMVYQEYLELKVFQDLKENPEYLLQNLG